MCGANDMPPPSAIVADAMHLAERSGRADWEGDNKRLPLIFYTSARLRLAAQQGGAAAGMALMSGDAAPAATSVPALTAAACRATAESAHVALAAGFPASDLKTIARDLMLCAQAARVFSVSCPPDLAREVNEAADVAEAAAKKIDPAEAARLGTVADAVAETWPPEKSRARRQREKVLRRRQERQEQNRE